MRTAVTASNASHTRVGTPAGNRVSDAVRWLDHRVAPVMTVLVIPHGLFPETFGPGAGRCLKCGRTWPSGTQHVRNGKRPRAGGRLRS